MQYQLCCVLYPLVSVTRLVVRRRWCDCQICLIVYLLLLMYYQGIRYIQGSVMRVHGNLKSGNCVIDSRWVLKITDYGENGIYERYQTKRQLSARGKDGPGRLILSLTALSIGYVSLLSNCQPGALRHPA